MAMEALTPVVREREIKRRGDRQALLDEWGIELKHLDASVRERVLFQGDHEIYQDAKMASDGFEHGFLAFDKVRERAKRHRDPLGILVRRGIMDLAEDEGAWRSVLLTDVRDTPVPAVRVAKYVHCVLHGEPDNFAAEGEQYPRFSVASSIKSVDVSEEGVVNMEPQEDLTAVFGPETHATAVRLEVWGPSGVQLQERLKGGRAAVDSPIGMPEGEAEPQ